ncbi:MAG: hypothetical protein GY765_20680, partial [bacterium]|nr:hypothetical protein [bacterium]
LSSNKKRPASESTPTPVSTTGEVSGRISNQGHFTIIDSVSDKVKSVFLSDLKNKLQEISSAQASVRDGGTISVEGLKSLKTIAHGYRGNAEYFGLASLGLIGRALEDAIKKHAPIQEVLELAGQLKRMLEKIFSANKK